MARFLKAVFRPVTNKFYQKRAVEYAEKLEGDEVTGRAPRYPTEQKFYQKIRNDKKIQAEINKRDDMLIENINKIKITSGDPQERWISTKNLTSDTEWVHRDDRSWEYGYYEPPTEKIPSKKLTFREAMEIMRTRLDLKLAQNIEHDRKDEIMRRISEILNQHPALKRVEREKLERVWQFFRPFERKEKQYLVNKYDMESVWEELQGFQRKDILPSFEETIKRLQRTLGLKKTISQTNETCEEAKIRLQKVMEIREAEENRLERQLRTIGALPEGEEEENDNAQKKLPGNG